MPASAFDDCDVIMDADATTTPHIKTSPASTFLNIGFLLEQFAISQLNTREVICKKNNGT